MPSQVRSDPGARKGCQHLRNPPPHHLGPHRPCVGEYQGPVASCLRDGRGLCRADTEKAALPGSLPGRRPGLWMAAGVVRQLASGPALRCKS